MAQAIIRSDLEPVIGLRFEIFRPIVEFVIRILALELTTQRRAAVQGHSTRLRLSISTGALWPIGWSMLMATTTDHVGCLGLTFAIGAAVIAIWPGSAGATRMGALFFASRSHSSAIV